MCRPIDKWCRAWPLIPLYLALCISASALAKELASAFVTRRDSTVPEGAIVYAIQAVAQHRPLYHDYGALPYVTTPYPPVYYCVAGAISRWWGSDTDTCYRTGRAITILSLLTSLMIGYSFVRQAHGTVSAALIGMGCFTTLGFASPWLVTCRPDMMALALSLGGLLAVSQRCRYGDSVAIALFVVSALTKHSYISAPMAAIVCLCICREPVRAVKLASGIIAGIAVAIAICQWWTDGWMLSNIVGANVTPARLEQPFVFLGSFLTCSYVPIVIVSACIYLRPAWPTTISPLVTAYALCAFVTALSSSSKLGADMNYFLEPGLALAILAGQSWRILAAWITESISNRVAWFVVGMLLCDSVVLSRNATHVSPEVSEIDQKRALAEINRLPGAVLIGDAGLAMRANKTVLLLDKFNASYLSEAGKVNFSELLSMLERKEVSAVVSDVRLEDSIRGMPWWPRPIQRAIAEHYFRDGKFAGYWLFRPHCDIRTSHGVTQHASHKEAETIILLDVEAYFKPPEK